MSKRIELIDRIKSSTTDPIKVESLGEYKEEYTADDFNGNSIPNWSSVLAIIPPSVDDPIIEPISTNSDGQFAYAYDGSKGNNPQFYVQQLVGDDILNRYDITVKINNAGDTITALSDFSMDSYQLVIRK